MESVVKYFGTIESSFRKTKIVTISAVAMAALISIVSLIYAVSYVSSHSDNIYILDQGGAFSASVSGSDAVNRMFEVEDHVKRFHEYMFTLTPSRDAIVRNMEMAMRMCDSSAYDYYMDQQEKQYYTRLIQTNSTQYIVVDSVKVNMNVLPYMEKTYARVFVLRESNISSYALESTGQLMNVGRSKSNPHGLMLEKFLVTRYEQLETRRR